MRIPQSLSAFGAAVLFASACSEANPVASTSSTATGSTTTTTDTLPASIVVQPSSATMGAYDTLRFQTVVKDAAGRVKTSVALTWNVSVVPDSVTYSGSLLSVDSSGLARSTNSSCCHSHSATVS